MHVIKTVIPSENPGRGKLLLTVSISCGKLQTR